MRRRRLVLLVSAMTFGVSLILAIGLGLFVTSTAAGRERLRAFVEPLIASRVQGKVFIGKLGGNLLTGITVDTFAIRDKNGELFLSTGPVSLTYDPRDFADYRILLRHARVERPFVHIIQHADGSWNFKQIFASKDDGKPKPTEVKRRSLGDYIVFDSTWTQNGTFLLTLPWRPDESLRGAARDSAIRLHLNNPQKYVSKRSDGYARTYTWKRVTGLIRHARIADPDSNHVGRQYVFDSLSVDEFEPTFKFRNVSGSVIHLGDTIRLAVKHFDMPASTGQAAGRIWWGGDRPIRYDINVEGDSVSLDDVNWVYPTLPRTGVGSLDLTIKNDPKDEHVLEYHVRNMDVRSMGSHLTGQMSFGVGKPVLLVRNVDLNADPVDFELLKTLAGKPFPYDWRGQIYGTVKAHGGPLTNFYVDDARATFRDAHVPGAVSSLTGHGELDILQPAFTAFHGFDVDAQTIDLRTIEFLNPNFPRLGGVVSGTATLDSSWLDVRFSNADITHRDGPGDPSHVTGSGRITTSDIMTYDVALDAQPVSLTMLGRSYPKLVAHGLMSGPIRAKGTAAELEVDAALQGSAGALSFAGTLDVDSIGGYGARGRGSFTGLGVAEFLERQTIPTGRLSGKYEADVSGPTAALLRGFVGFELDSTTFDRMRVYATSGRVELADGRMRIVDSLRVQTAAGLVVARGGFGLPKGQPDSLDISFTIDSLGGLRRYLSKRDTTALAAAATVLDSLSGNAEFHGSMVGTMDAFRLTGTATGTALTFNKIRGQSANVTLALNDLPHAANGTLEFHVDTMSVGSLALQTVGGSLALTDRTHGRFSASALSKNGSIASTLGSWIDTGANRLVVVDSLGLSIGDGQWQLAGPARIALDSVGGVRVDSLLLRNRESAVVAFAADVPEWGSASAQLHASNVPMRDLGILAQIGDTLGGSANVNVTVTGTKATPAVDLRANLQSLVWGSVPIDNVVATGAYRSGRFTFDANATRGDKGLLKATGSVPAAVTLFSLDAREDSISAKIETPDTTDLEIVKALIKPLRGSKISGKLLAAFDIRGTWRAPAVSGDLRVYNGVAEVPGLGVTIGDINGSVVGTRAGDGQDNLQINLTAATEGRPTGTARLWGNVKNLLQAKNQQSFDLMLDAHEFHAFKKRSSAELFVSSMDTIRLRGTTQAPVLTGRVLVDRGAIYLADRDIARKQAVDFDVDTVGQTQTSALFSKLMTNLRVENFTVALGEDVRLKSAEANAKLTGTLQLQASTNRSRRIASASGAPIPVFDLDGVLSTESGSYNLNLGVVQREFTVLPGGTVTFDGDPNNPSLDIKAQHNVRRPNDRDLGVVVSLQGRLLPRPDITLSSNADYAIAQSDLFSYLLIGRAGFDYTANQETSDAVGAFFAPTASAWATDKLRQQLGFFDAFQVQFGTRFDNITGNDNLKMLDYLYSSSIAAEKQFGIVWMSVNTGFCGLQPGATENGAIDPTKLLGAKAELRISPEFSFNVSYDPGSGRICGKRNVIGLEPPPGQFGLSFSHNWRF
jgi:translocation and assembly module TamB